MTPDATCGGSQRKAWVLLDGNPQLLKASNDESTAILVGEVLASQLLGLLLAPDDFVPHELFMYDDTLCSASPLFVREGADLLDASLLGDFEEPLTPDGTWKRPDWEGIGRALDSIGIDGWERSLTKLAVVSALCLYGDIQTGNLGVLRECASGALTLPPLYDLGGAFGTFSLEIGRFAKANRKFAERFVTWGFRGLDPTWDYSWCDLAPLESFGETVEDMFSQCKELVAGDCPAFARKLFESQLAYVASIVER